MTSVASLSHARRLALTGSAAALALSLAMPAFAQTPVEGNTTPATPGTAASPQPAEGAALGAPNEAAAGPAQSDDSAAAPQEVVVTGSRIARRDYSADSPVVTVGQQALTTTSGVALESKLNQLPQFTPGQTGVGAGASTGGTAQATLNLRGLGDFRNLILLDGKRLQPSSGNVTVDINTLPASIIDNVEVISGGASAVYGSDAISGVVNFKLRHNFEDLELNGSSTINQKGDGFERQIGALIGGKFADDRGSAILAMDYTKRGVVYEQDRSFYRNSYRSGTGSSASIYLPQGYFEGNPFNPVSQAAVNSVFGGYGYAPGTVGAGGNLGFNTNGSLFTTTGGAINYQGPLYPEFAINPAGSVVTNAGVDQYLLAPLERYSAFGRVDYKLGDDITAYAQALYTDYTSHSQGAPAPADGLWVLNVPYSDGQHAVPADLATLLASRPNPTADFQIGKRLDSVGPIKQTNSNQVYQLLAGLSGKIGGSNDLTWEVYGSHGQTKISNEVDSGAVNYQTLLDLIARPNYGAGASDPANNRSCTSGIQLFGDVPMSADCVNWITARTKSETVVKQDIVEATLQGKIVPLPAGDLRFAVGADYRKDSYSFDPDALLSTAQSNNVVGTFGSEATSGSTSVWELYGELLVPVLADKPFVKSLDVDLAYRYSDYKISGGVHTYKASADWAIVDALRIRGGYQRAIRAPNVAELYQGAALTIGLWPDSDPCSVTSQASYGNSASNPNRAQVQALCTALGVPNVGSSAGSFTYGTPLAIGQAVGNTDLKPEKADTYTLGVVLRPKFESPLFRRLSASVDAYSIKVSGAIGLLPVAGTYASCFNADGSNPTYSATNASCLLIHRDNGATTATGIATGIPTWTDQPYANLGGFKTQGIDVQVDWGIPLGDGFGTLDLNFVGSYLDKFKVQASPDAPWQDFAGTIGNTVTGVGFFPKWRHVMTATLDLKPVSFGGRWHYYDAVDYYTNVTIPGDTTPGTKAYSSFDLFATVDVNKSLQFRLGVDNLTDKQPLTVAGVPGSTSPTVYDPLGRRFYVSARARF